MTTQPPEEPILRLRTWLSALEDWLADEKAKRPSQDSPTLSRAVRSFWAFSRKRPWEVEPEDGRRWAEALDHERLCGSTVYHKMLYVRRFYVYCREHAIDPQGLPPDNPACGISFPPGYRRSRVVALTADQVRRLLEGVDRESSLVGQRDYAMLLLALRLGLEREAIRLLRWEQIHRDGEQVSLTRRKRASRKQAAEKPAGALDLSGEPWEAMRACLAATGRLDGIGPQDYVFAPMDRRQPVPQPGAPGGWNPARPISARNMELLLQQYLHWAGLDDWGIVGWSTLRRTAFTLRLAAGEDLPSLHRLLGRSSLKSSRRFLRELAEEAARAFINAPSDTEGQPLPGPHRLPMGHPATHGFYIKRLRRPGTFKEGIERWHKTAFIALEMAEEAEKTKDSLRYLELASRAFYRSSSLRLRQYRLALELKKRRRAGK